MADLRIDWRFHPPYANHRGGAAKRMIRSIRKALLSAVSTQLLTDKQIQTVMCEAERVVKSRPFTYTNNDPRDYEVLTTAKLLLLDDDQAQSLEASAPTTITPRWRDRAQHIADVFLKQWARKYLPQLQQLCKWTTKKPSLKPGDVVMLADRDWPRGK